jgi:hypothetical protein
MSEMSVLWMAPPYFLIGVSECLISVQLYDLCYNEVPAELRSTAQALNLLMTALSGAIAAAVTIALADFEPADLNDGHVEYNYYFAAALAIATIPAFIHASHRFESILSTTDGHASMANGDASTGDSEHGARREGRLGGANEEDAKPETMPNRSGSIVQDIVLSAGLFVLVVACVYMT